MTLDPRFVYAAIGAGIVLGFVLIVLLLRGGPVGAGGAAVNLGGFWAWLEGKKTVGLILAVVGLRYIDRRGWIDAQLFTDLQDLLIGGGALTALAKVNRIETKQDVAAVKVEQVAAAASEAVDLAATTHQAVRAALKPPGP